MPLENFENSYFCFRLAQFLTSFSYINNHLLLCAVFHIVSSSIDHVLCINLSPEVLVFGSFNVHRNDLVKSVITSKDLTQIAYFQAKIPDCDSHSTAYLDLFISSNPTTSSVVASSLLCEILIIIFFVSVSIDFPSISKVDASFHLIAFDYSRTHCNVLCDHLRHVLWEDILQ